jgi:hypothetical protein
MHKHAAATALAIALITMLTLASSASLTPANAGGVQYFDNVVCVCWNKCAKKVNSYEMHLRCPWTDYWTHCNPLTAFRDAEPCIASCGRIEGVEHLSQSVLRARLKAKEASRR